MKRAAILWVVLALPAAALRAQDPKPVWIDVPYVHQSPEGCGAAALAMLTAYWAEQEGLAGSFSDGTPAQREQARAERDLNIIERDLSSRGGRGGIAAKVMQAYLDQHGFITFALEGKWRDLEKEIGQGRPLIVAVRPRGDPQLHYVVIAGVDPVHSMVVMNDPAGRKLITEERAEFEKDWSATHNWMLLAMPESSRMPERMQQRQP
ncbi:MAG TPA: C39 family peptidase [Terracidiphilus sp.]|jgi:ABC-type bacteriocin/lantibiotic exporter with double-glycine peptidase domain|nr:C39 family peptidase [Terracidiphilus sp.]